MKRLLAALLLTVATAASANSSTTDLSDMWWNPSESGWGMNLIHQNDTLFITLFVYASGSAPTWYVAPQVEYSSSLGGSLNYQGALYATTGPWIGASWDATQVGARQVGTLTVRATSIETLVLTYNVEGISVEKALTRQTWRTNYVGGQYFGGVVGTYTQCPVNGYREEQATFSISHDAPGAATIVAVGTTGTCTYTGTYSQSGRLGQISGTYSCTNAPSGEFRVFELEVSISAFGARAVAANGFCSWSGRMGGVRRGG